MPSIKSVTHYKCLIILFTCLFSIAACGTDTTNTKPAGTPTPTATPTPGVTPTVPIPTITSRAVTFSTPDNVKLAGLLYGQGKTAVIFSHMLRTDKSIWVNSGMPQRLATQGYMALAYDFRGYKDSAGDTDPQANTKDLIAAIKFVRTQGATSIVLMGASMGGSATLEAAISEPVTALVTLSAPLNFTYDITDKDLKGMKAAKLFINSEYDTYTDDTKHSYEVASDPKEMHLYTGNLHGTDLFEGSQSADLTQRILTFVNKYAPSGK